MTQAPAIVRYWNPLARGLLRAGLPMGPNLLLTVRGRVSGEPRTAPVAVLDIDGRRYVLAAYGDVHWVRNLRVAREADLEARGGREHVTARELAPDEAVAFYRGLPAIVRRYPWFGRAFAKALFGLVGPEVLQDPEAAAARHPVFELTAAR